MRKEKQRIMHHWRKSLLAVLTAVSLLAGNTVPVYAEDVVTEEAGAAEEQRVITAEEQSAVTADTTEAETTGIQYVFVDETNLQLPGVQNIVVGFTDETVLPEHAALKYHSRISGTDYESEASALIDGAVLFSETYTEDMMPDEYVLDGICYTINGQEITTLFSDAGLEMTGYTVGTAESGIQAYGMEETAPETNVYILDEDEEMVVESGDEASTEETIAAAMEQAEIQPAGKSRAANAQNVKKLVVFLCAGHDSTHSGATAYGLREEDLTFKVQQYCKEELQKYGDVEALTDRDSVECKYPESSLSACLNQRIIDAAALGADVFVDLHFNSTGFGGQSGAEVYYPNISYNAWIHQEGKDLADYYTTMNVSKEYGMTGIIVEHAYIDHAGDAGRL